MSPRGQGAAGCHGQGLARSAEPEDVGLAAPGHRPVAVAAGSRRGHDPGRGAARNGAGVLARDEVLAGAVEEVLPEVAGLEVQRERARAVGTGGREAVTGAGDPAVVADRLQGVAAAGHRVAVLRHGATGRALGEGHEPRRGLAALPCDGGGGDRGLDGGRRVRGVGRLLVTGGPRDGVLGLRVVVVVGMAVDAHGRAVADGRGRVRVGFGLRGGGLHRAGCGGVPLLQEGRALAGGLAIGRDEEAGAHDGPGGDAHRPDQPSSYGSLHGAGLVLGHAGPSAVRHDGYCNEFQRLSLLRTARPPRRRVSVSAHAWVAATAMSTSRPASTG